MKFSCRWYGSTKQAEAAPGPGLSRARLRGYSSAPLGALPVAAPPSRQGEGCMRSRTVAAGVFAALAASGVVITTTWASTPAAASAYYVDPGPNAAQRLAANPGDSPTAAIR